jgi:TetR/AcrR family transcriptional repressor of multidrug resistance operon
MFYFFSEYLAPRMNVQSETADKRKAILQTTLELIRQYGLQGTPISLIAKNANVAAGTIYYYFQNKEAIISELHNVIREEMLAAMFTEKNEGKDFRSQFFSGWTNLCRYFIANPGSLIFIQQYNSAPDFKSIKKQNNKIPVDKFSEFFQSGMDNGFLKKMEYNLVASVVFGAIIATAKYHISGRFDYTDGDLCKIATIIWDGIKLQ